MEISEAVLSTLTKYTKNSSGVIKVMALLSENFIKRAIDAESINHATPGNHF